MDVCQRTPRLQQPLQLLARRFSYTMLGLTVRTWWAPIEGDIEDPVLNVGCLLIGQLESCREVLRSSVEVEDLRTGTQIRPLWECLFAQLLGTATHA